MVSTITRIGRSTLRQRWHYQSSLSSCSSIPLHKQQPAPSQRNQHQHQSRNSSTLILLRHGQSQWNGTAKDPEPRFTGWSDIPLTVRGRVEAVAAGQLLRSRGFKASRVDAAFTSDLQRAHETCELTLASMAGPEQHTWCPDRIRRDWRLNERHYGCVQGYYKGDTSLSEKYGDETINRWRRSMTDKPPPIEESHESYLPPPAPRTESLWDCQVRAMECFHSTIAPALFDCEVLPTPPDLRAIIVVAHANTIRSLMAAFDEVPMEMVPKLYVPNSVPILYQFDRNTRKPNATKLQGAAGCSHARWLISAENHHAVRRAVKSGGTLTRALFDAMDARGEGYLNSKDIGEGLKLLLKDDLHPPDCVVIAVAKKIKHELGPHSVITFEEFEAKADRTLKGLREPTDPFADELYA